MENTKQAFRLVAICIKKETNTNVQYDIWGRKIDRRTYKHVVVTNDLELSTEEIFQLCSRHSDESENAIREMKEGFSMDYVPFSDCDKGNELFMAIQCLA